MMAAATRQWWTVLALLLCAPGSAWANSAAGPVIVSWPQCLAGRYDGGGQEMAARLGLNGDGRFVYELSYGALEEIAEGQWLADGRDVLLSSDPVREPQFSVVSDETLADSELQVALDLPRGISAQFFEVLVGFADGGRMIRQMSDEGVVIPLEPGREIASVVVTLPVYALQSATIAASGGSGRALRVRFDPNELGKVRFDKARLRREGADLLLDRHGRQVRFRPEGRGCAGR